MPIDDDLEKSEFRQAIADEAERSTQSLILRAQIAGLISWFLPPWAVALAAGASEGLNQLASRRFYARLQEMRDAMHSRLNQVDESKVNKEWFLSEEFQTMLFEASRQVTATADRQKIEMLGNALANGGIADFSAETRKELFLQIIRDLTPQHIAMLRQLVPDDSRSFEIRWRTRTKLSPVNEENLAVLQMLAANGLVTETITPPHVSPSRLTSYRQPTQADSIKALQQISKELLKPPKRTFQLSTFGQAFLDFVSFAHSPSDEFGAHRE